MCTYHYNNIMFKNRSYLHINFIIQLITIGYFLFLPLTGCVKSQYLLISTTSKGTKNCQHSGHNG